MPGATVAAPTFTTAEGIIRLRMEGVTGADTVPLMLEDTIRMSEQATTTVDISNFGCDTKANH